MTDEGEQDLTPNQGLHHLLLRDVVDLILDLCHHQHHLQEDVVVVVTVVMRIHDLRHQGEEDLTVVHVVLLEVEEGESILVHLRHHLLPGRELRTMIMTKMTGDHHLGGEVHHQHQEGDVHLHHLLLGTILDQATLVEGGQEVKHSFILIGWQP